MRSWLVLLALALVDYTIYASIEWLHLATKISSEIDHSFLAELAFVVCGIVVMIGAPACGWRLMARTDDRAEGIPRARIVR
jgi:hypothetical protein